MIGKNGLRKKSKVEEKRGEKRGEMVTIGYNEEWKGNEGK